MFFSAKMSENFSESDIERRNLIPVYMEHLRIGYIQPRDIVDPNEVEMTYLKKDVKGELDIEALNAYDEIYGDCNRSRRQVDIEFVKTRNEKPKAIEAFVNLILDPSKDCPVESLLYVGCPSK
jgi:hypothetical protein